MADMCTCMITGRLTADSELKYVGNNGLLRFSVAVGRYEKGNTITSFFDCVQWGKAAEALSAKLTKGRTVVVRGEMRQEFWNDSDGARRSRWILAADAFGVQPIYMGNSGGEGNGKSKQNTSQSGNAWDDDDIPF